VHPAAATEVFEKDCLVPLGPALAPAGPVRRSGEEICRVTVSAGSAKREETMISGELKLLPLAAGESAEVVARPSRRFDCGAGAGREVRKTVRGGMVGLILDGRGRPLWLPEDAGERRARMRSWLAALGIGI